MRTATRTLFLIAALSLGCSPSPSGTDASNVADVSTTTDATTDTTRPDAQPDASAPDASADVSAPDVVLMDAAAPDASAPEASVDAVAESAVDAAREAAVDVVDVMNVVDAAADVREAGVDASADVAASDVVSCAGLTASIRSATDGLLYTSESDYPLVTEFFNGQGATAPTAATVLRLGHPPAGATTESDTIDRFFMAVVVDPTRTPPVPDTRPAMLRSLVESSLHDLIVVRVIDPANRSAIAVYLVGRTACGDLLWLRSTSIET